MNILVVNGSRNHTGQTARAAATLLEGARSAGAQGEAVFLPELNIERCRQCNNDGWGLCRSAGRCVIDDDLAGVVERMKKADAVVFATPVYFGDLSESLRAFLDRVRRTCMHPDGKKGLEGKPAMGVCVAGGGGGGAPACCLSLEKVLRTCGFDVLDLIPVRRQNLEAKLGPLGDAGKSLASISGAA